MLRGQCALRRQITWQSVKQLLTHGDLLIFQNVGRPPYWICCTPECTILIQKVKKYWGVADSAPLDPHSKTPSLATACGYGEVDRLSQTSQQTLPIEMHYITNWKFSDDTDIQWCPDCLSPWLLPSALAGKVMRSVVSVCPSLCYHSIF